MFKLLLLMLIISTNAYAEEDEYEWKIEEIQSKGVMYSKNGEYVWGDRIYFIKEAKDCEKDSIIFSWSSDEDDHELYSINLFTLYLDGVELKTLDGDKYKLGARLQDVKTIAGPLKALHYSRIELKPWLKDKLLSAKELKVKTSAKNVNLDTATYDFSHFKKSQKRAFDMCKGFS